MLKKYSEKDKGKEINNKRTHLPCFFLMLCCISQLVIEQEESFEFNNNLLITLFEEVYETRIEPSIDSRFSISSFIQYWKEYSAKNVNRLGIVTILHILTNLSITYLSIYLSISTLYFLHYLLVRYLF
jgi:hypothetical protein